MVVICLRKRRHICPACGKKFYEGIISPEYHRMTSRLAAYVISALKEIGSMKGVAERANISQSTVVDFDHGIFQHGFTKSFVN